MQWRVGEMTGVDSLRSNESHVKPEGEAMHVASSPALEAQRNINPGGGGGGDATSLCSTMHVHTRLRGRLYIHVGWLGRRGRLYIHVGWLGRSLLVQVLLLSFGEVGAVTNGTRHEDANIESVHYRLLKVLFHSLHMQRGHVYTVERLLVPIGREGGVVIHW